MTDRAKDGDLTAQQIREMLADRVETVLGRVMPGAQWRQTATQWRCGGPHGAPGTSFCVYVGSHAKAGRYRDFEGDPAGQSGSMIDLIMLVRGCDQAEAFRFAREEILGYPARRALTAEERRRIERDKEQAAERARERERRSQIEKARKAENARELWRRVGPVRGTDGEIYFRELRGISVPAPCRFVQALRYWVEGSDTKRIDLGAYPCIVTPMIADRGGQASLTALHLTYIDLAAPKGKLRLTHPETGEPVPAKKFRGDPADGWIRLTSARPVMAVAEGIENTQSVLDARPDWGGWCAGSSGRFGVLRFPGLVRRVVGCGETDSGCAKDAVGNPVFKPDGSPLVPADESLRHAARLWADGGRRRVDLVWLTGDANHLTLLPGRAASGRG